VGTDPEGLAAEQCSGELTCKHDGVCQTNGEANYGIVSDFEYLSPIKWLETTSTDRGEYCLCPTGYVGVNCKHSYEICDQDTGFACFHGGKCVEIGAANFERRWACDCSETTWAGEPEFFAGRHCEYRSTEACRKRDDGLEERRWFCVNQGECHDEATEVLKKCKCVDDWFGPHCEFHKNKGQPLGEGETPQAGSAYEKFRPSECTLSCRNGGKCIFGIKDYGDHEDMEESSISGNPNFAKHEGGMHCVCPDGYTGLICQIPAEKCGNELYCYNGAECNRAVNSDGTSRSFCNCATAASNNNDKSFAGMGCQHQSGVFCDPNASMRKDQAFCVNGGTCWEEANKDSTVLGCQCKEPWTGQHCELHKEEDSQEAVQKWMGQMDCTIECQNGGRCSFGVKDYGKLAKLNAPFRTHLEFEHCVCPEGFTGVDCSVPVQHCPNSRQACFYGSECIQVGYLKEELKGDFMCHCEKGRTPNAGGEEAPARMPVAGRYCEHYATEVCSEDGESAGNWDWHSFCTNGGKCRKNVKANEDHAGCDCPEQWEGEFCELKKREHDGESLAVLGRGNGLAVAVLAVLLGLVLPFV